MVKVRKEKKRSALRPLSHENSPVAPGTCGERCVFFGSPFGVCEKFLLQSIFLYVRVQVRAPVCVCVEWSGAV